MATCRKCGADTQYSVVCLQTVMDLCRPCLVQWRAVAEADPEILEHIKEKRSAEISVREADQAGNTRREQTLKEFVDSPETG